ncbi:hypothetical protein [Desulfuromonas sp. TF]|uniref:hypothetical protein n=1 Tax=Desulfuromonas sp. TF TaxID=1232410 RepID=UPI0012DD5B13|nr:hypothetical protein [Desulfuromonas sp. TF]
MLDQTEKNKSKAIGILGMHRSGTSALARAVNLAGAYLGEEGSLYGPLQDNPEGFWERIDFNDFQERLLALLKRRWDIAMPIPERVWNGPEIAPYKNELLDLVRQNFAGQPLWAWKDPRSCILLPLWKQVLEELGTDFVCIMAVRNPLDVARSLQKRNNFPISKSLGIWLEYTLAILREVRGIPTTVLFYDDLLEKGSEEIRRCFDDLALPWQMTEESQGELERFLRPDLRHSKTGKSLPEEKFGPVARIYNALGDISGGQTDLLSALPEDIRSIDDNFKLYAGYFEPDVEDAVALAEKVSLQDKELSARDRQLSAKDQQLIARDQQLSAKVRQISELRNSVDEQATEINRLKNHLHEMENSMSWKITRPLRSVGRALIPPKKQ